MHVILLEDDIPLNKAIVATLRQFTFTVQAFTEGDALLEAIRPGVDLYILDINVPGLNGIEVLESIRSIDNATPVIMISADKDIETISKAYDVGCNDYLKKPFDIRELEIKVTRMTHADSVIAINEHIAFDQKSDVLTIDGQPVKLTRKELLFVKILLANRGLNVTYDRMIDFIWDGETSDVNQDALRSLASRVRGKVGSDVVSCNVGLGYSLSE